MEGHPMLAYLDISSGSGAVALDVFFLLIVLAIMIGVVRIARRLTAWRIERRMGGKRGTGESEQVDTLRRLSELRNSGSLSEEEFEAAKARVREE
jgi:Kef-type K+ transport system membrane component KefB